MGNSEFIAALDLGTSKIIAMAGRKNEQGILSIIASEKTTTDSCIRRGCVHNVADTAEKIKTVIAGLNRQLEVPVEKIYVGLGGQSLHTENHVVSKDINGAIVDDQMIQSLYDECQEYEPAFGGILDIVSPEYYLDGHLEANPKGIQCSRIEAHYKLIVGRPLLQSTLKNSIENKAQLSIAGYFIAPIASAAAVLNETEKELGCALIELGAGVTYLSVYKGGLLRYLVTIPLGGAVVTNDIRSLNILEEEAERLKINFGSALIEFDSDIKAQTAKLVEESLNGSMREIKLNDLNDIIEARMDEIIANIMTQINLSEYGTALGAGIIITGGGAAMNNLAESIRNKTKMNVRTAAVKKSLVNQSIELAQDYANSEVIGLLVMGKDNCAKEVVKQVVIEKDGQGTIFGEVPVTPPVNPVRHRRKGPEDQIKGPVDGQRSGRGLFGMLGKKIEQFSNSLFDEEDGHNKRNENEHETNNENTDQETR